MESLSRWQSCWMPRTHGEGGHHSILRPAGCPQCGGAFLHPSHSDCQHTKRRQPHVCMY
jgi:hypothetical protein